MLVCDAAAKEAHPHSFRHTFCINLARAEIPLHVIQELTGHKMLNTLRIYLRVTQGETDKAISKLPTGAETGEGGLSSSSRAAACNLV